MEITKKLREEIKFLNEEIKSLNISIDYEYRKIIEKLEEKEKKLNMAMRETGEDLRGEILNLKYKIELILTHTL